MANDQVYGVDVPKVTNDQAVALVVHHLELAAAYYEAAETEEIWAALETAFEEDTLRIGAARAWWVAMKIAYDRLDRNENNAER
jgi:hypothetical protein